MLIWAQVAIGTLHSGIAHERQPNFRHGKKKENRKIERGEFITPPRPTGRRRTTSFDRFNRETMGVRGIDVLNYAVNK